MKPPFARIAAVVLLSLPPAAPLAAQEPAQSPAVQMLQGRMQDFFQQLAEQRTADAFQRLLQENPQLQKRAQAMIQRSDQLQRQYGRLVSFRRLQVRQLGPNLVVLQYLAEHQRLPVVWYAAFYRPPQSNAREEESWMVVQLRLETDLHRAAFGR